MPRDNSGCSSGDGHCCWFKGVECRYLEENSEAGRRWSCQLRREHGEWEAVYRDDRYIKNIIPLWEDLDCGITRCGDWPGPGQTCGECGVNG